MDVNMVSSLNATTKSKTTEHTSQTRKTDFSDYLDKEQKKTTTLDAIFAKAADKYNVDVNLLKAIGKAESDFNTRSTSHCGAKGIMQLMPATAKFLGVKDSYDPEQNIMGGAKYISRLIKQYDGNVTLALAAYNAGSGNVRKYGGVPPFKETQNYIKKINKFMSEGVSIPKKYNSVSITSQTDYSKYTNTSPEVEPTPSKPEVASTEQSSNTPVSIVNLSPAQQASFDALRNETDAINSLQSLMSKINKTSDDTYTPEEYTRFMQLYLDNIAVANLSSDDEPDEELKKIVSRAINYNKTTLDLLTGTDVDKNL